MKILIRIVKIGMLLILAFLAQSAIGSSRIPVSLLVNGVHDPFAIDRDTTRFTWSFAETTRGARQTAYEIVVERRAEGEASSGGTSETGSNIWWDSGKVDSGQSASVEYRGPALPAATRFFWKVRIWDQTGRPGPFSGTAFFDTGLDPGDWTAQYIWDGTTNLNNFAYFRKTFVLTNKPALAKVYVTAHNDYLLFCNGQLVGRGPARCDPYHYGQYNAFDVTRLLKPGTNVFAAMGHWLGTWNDSGVNARPAFLLQARFVFPDGSSATIGTDNSWKALAHTPFIETNATYFGGAGGARNRAAIKYDSRLEQLGWKSLYFDDSRWSQASVVDRPDYRLFAQMAPLEREQAALKPVSITFTNRAWFVDFGRCIDGWPKLTMHANRPGDVVRVEYFEMTGERKPAGWDEYICRGGDETWDADFGRHTSFAVLKITGYAGKLESADVRGMWAYCDADVAGRFQCSSPLLNAIFKMCERSARQNVQQGMISVDANREQSSWLADSWNIGNVLLYNDRDTMMMDKVVRDYGAAQFPDGNFPSCSPARRGGDYPPPGQASRRIPEWSMYWPMLLWQQYLFSGDQTLLRQMAPHLTHFLEWIGTYQDPATRLLNPPGWRISEYAGGNMPSGGYNIATTCQYYDDLKIASHIFLILGKINESHEDWKQAEAVRGGINAHLFNGEYYQARTDREQLFPLASAWALRFDIEPKQDKARILAAIETPAKPDIGGYGGDAFYSGLLNAGAGAFVVKDLARYRLMLKENKANWETWNSSGEVNHAWTSYPGYLFQKYFLGIQPTSGGFATFDVRPDISGLQYAEGTVPTVKGLITMRWEKDSDDNLSLVVHVPANTQATIYIPKLARENFTVTESGNQLWPPRPWLTDRGVQVVSETDSAIECGVGAGDYRFNENTANTK